MTDGLLDTPLIQSIGWALVHFIWQGAVIGAATAIALRALDTGVATTRYFVACAGLAVMLVAPASTVLTSRVSDPVSSISVVTAARDLAAVIPAPDRVLSLAVVMWGTGVLLLSLRLVAACVGIERLKRATKAVDEAVSMRVNDLALRLGIERSVRVVESTMVRVPAIVGWLRPAILLPASVITGLPAAHLDAVLAHELAHVRRHDYLVNALQSVAEILLFYHPVVWWCSRQIRIEREHCCDDVVVEVCGDRVAYAAALTQLEELRRLQPMLSLNVNGGRLVDRIRRLLGQAPVEDQRPTTLMIAAAVTAMVTAIVLTPALTIAEAAHRDVAVQADGRQAGPPVPAVPPRPARPPVPPTPRMAAQAPAAPAPPAPSAPSAAPAVPAPERPPAPPAAPAQSLAPPAAPAPAQPPAPPAAPAPAQPPAPPAAPAPAQPPAPPASPDAPDDVSQLAIELERASQELVKGVDELQRAAADLARQQMHLARQQMQLRINEAELAKMRQSALATRAEIEAIHEALAELSARSKAVQDRQLDGRNITKQLEALTEEIEKMRAR